MKGSRQTSIRCSEHGDSKWTGQVICTGCKAVWHLTDPTKVPPDPLGTCTCGKLLVGPHGTAKAICPTCFAQRWTAAAPTIPAPPEPEKTLH